MFFYSKYHSEFLDRNLNTQLYIYYIIIKYKKMGKNKILLNAILVKFLVEFVRGFNF